MCELIMDNNNNNNQKVKAFRWKIENVSTIQSKGLYSDILYVGGDKWKLLVLPKGRISGDQLSVSVLFADSVTMPQGWSRYAQCSFTLVNQLDTTGPSFRGGVTKHEFNANCWVHPSFIPPNELLDPKKGYVVNDACLLEVVICTDDNIDLETINLIDIPPPVELKTLKKEADDCLALVEITKPEPELEITTDSQGKGQDKAISTAQNLPTTQNSTQISDEYTTVDSECVIMDNHQTLKAFRWKIENLSTIKTKGLYSDIFYVGGNKWKLHLVPKVSSGDQLLVYLVFVDSGNLPQGWRIHAQCRFTLINHLGTGPSFTGVSKCEFNEEKKSWGRPLFMPLSKLLDPEKGYVANDACLLKVAISTDKNIDLKSIKYIDLPCPVELKSKAAMDKQDETIEVDQDPTEEDVNTFFTSLESELELACVNVTPSHKAAKEALAKIEEALRMSPSYFHDSGKISTIKNAIKVVSAFGSSRPVLTSKQKAKLLDMEGSFKELPERVVKAMHHKNLFAEKESRKLTLSDDLEHCLSKFKENEKKKEKLLAEQKEIFKVTKKLKTELEALGTEWEWAEYEAMTKAAEEEEKNAVAEWGRMKGFIASIKGNILTNGPKCQ